MLVALVRNGDHYIKIRHIVPCTGIRRISESTEYPGGTWVFVDGDELPMLVEGSFEEVYSVWIKAKRNAWKNACVQQSTQNKYDKE